MSNLAHVVAFDYFEEFARIEGSPYHRLVDDEKCYYSCSFRRKWMNFWDCP